MVRAESTRAYPAVIATEVEQDKGDLEASERQF